MFYRPLPNAAKSYNVEWRKKVSKKWAACAKRMKVGRVDHHNWQKNKTQNRIFI